MLMTALTGRNYQPGHKWSRQQLKSITPDKIARYIKERVYGDAEARPDEDPPVNNRCNTVLTWKKSWSYFMLDSGTPWSEVAKVGNPTRATAINRIIRGMKKMEASRRGKPSQARRPLLPPEFEAIIETLSKHKELEVGTWLSAYLSFMYNMIARVDDTAKFRSPDLQPFNEFPDYGVTAKLCWTKNTNEEREPPTQILFGSCDWRYCVVSLLAVWLEYHFELNSEENEFYFGYKGATDPDSIKATAAYHLKKICDNLAIDMTLDEAMALIGTHSIRKFAVNKGRGAGLSRDEVDHHGRWKSGNRQSDTYCSTTSPFVDAKAASTLCTGGPVAYLVREESGITDEWLKDHVVPNMVAAGLSSKVCVVLGRALLWKVAEQYLDTDAGHLIPASITDRVMSAFHDLGERNRLPVNVNPVNRVNLGVSGVDARLHVFKVLGEDNVRPSEGLGGGADARSVRHEQGVANAEFRFVASEVAHLRRENTDLREELKRRDARHLSEITMLRKALQRIASQPGRRVVPSLGAETDGAAAEAAGPPAQLCNRPKFLHELWKEWMAGMGGNKAAKDFTSAERGKAKTKYSARKVFWDKISELVRAGHTSERACDLVYEAYGHSTGVSEVLRRMAVDRRANIWPDYIRVRRF